MLRFGGEGHGEGGAEKRVMDLLRELAYEVGAILFACAGAVIVTGIVFLVVSLTNSSASAIEPAVKAAPIGIVLGAAAWFAYLRVALRPRK